MIWQLVSSKDQRIYKIIEILYDSDLAVTISTIAKETNSSIRTIKYDLTDLKKILSVYNGYLTSSPSGIRMELPTHIGIDVFQRSIFKTSPALQLLELIFLNENYTSSELEQLLFISSSSLNRLAVQINEVLAQYKLSLDTSPFKITGDEALIRRFYSMFFTESCSITEWPFQCVSRRLIYASLDVGIQYYGYKPDAINLFKFAISFAVGISRTLHGHTSESVQVSRDINIEKRQFDSFQKAVSPFLKNENLSEDELLVYFNDFSYWKYVLKLQNPLERKKESFLRHRNITDVEEMINELTYLFDLPTDNYVYLQVELNHALSFYSQNPVEVVPLPYLLFPPKDYGLMEKFKHQYPIFYQTALEKFEVLLNDRAIPLSDGIKNNLMYILLSKWHTLSKCMHDKFYPCKILLYSHFTAENARSLASEIRSEIGYNVTITTHAPHHINLDSIKDHDFDILVTTTTLYFDIGRPIFYLYRKGETLNLHQLKELTQQVIDNKKAAYRMIIKERQSQLKNGQAQ